MAPLKSEVRAEAAALGLAVAAKPDSHDICFIPTGDTAGFLQGHLGAAPGEIVDAVTGEVVGAHEGAYAFTVGQRRGVGLGTPAPDGARRYVVDVDISRRRVSVGPVAMLDVHRISAIRPRWCGPALEGSAALGVQVRAHGEEIPAAVTPQGSGFVAELSSPLRGVAPGQAAVLYDGSRVVGSGTIARGVA